MRKKMNKITRRNKYTNTGMNQQNTSAFGFAWQCDSSSWPWLVHLCACSEKCDSPNTVHEFSFFPSLNSEVSSQRCSYTCRDEFSCSARLDKQARKVNEKMKLTIKQIV